MKYVLLKIVVAALAVHMFCVDVVEAADKWLSVETKNFLLVGNASESQIRRVGRTLEQFREGFATIFPAVKNQSPIGTTIVVFKDDGSFKPFKPLYEGKPANIAGYFQSSRDVNFIALTGDVRTPRIIYHEYVHALTKDSTSPLPPWASEGIAEFYSTFEITSSGKEIGLGIPIGEHVRLLQERPLIPVSTLLTVDQDSPHYNEETKQGIFYAQSWALVHYLMTADGGQRRSQFAKYLTLVANGKSVEESCREAFGIDFAGIDKLLYDYIRNRLAWPYYKIKLEEKLDFDREMRLEALTEAQSKYYLGDLMLHINRRDTAEKQLETAINLDPKLAGPYASMGMLRMREDKDEEALQFLEKAVQSESKNHMAHYYYASLLQQLSRDERTEDRQEQLELMRTHLKKTIELAPYFVEAYDLLVYVDLVTGTELDDAEKKLSKAISLAPGRQLLRITLAQVMIANDKAIAARTLLTQLRANSNDPAIRDQAEELLSRIATYLESQAAMREYEERRKAAGIQTETASVDATSDTPPRLTRDGVPVPKPETDMTFKVPERKVEGPQVEGFLTNIDCAKGMTLQVRVGNGFVRLHTETPSKVDFVSYATNVKDEIACGPVKPELKVVIIYKRGSDPSVLGEPLVVEFRP